MRTMRAHSFGWIILITHENALIKFFGTVLLQVIVPRANFKSFPTPKDAVDFLLSQDDTVQITDSQFA